MDVCLASNGRLRVLRARFSALTHNEVWRAVGSHLGAPDGAAAAAVTLRQEIDLRLGAAFTRFQTMALQDAFEWGEFAREDGKGPLISYGPCQFPTLGFIVQRAWEAAAHVREAFWRITLGYTAPDGRTAEFNWTVRRESGDAFVRGLIASSPFARSACGCLTRASRARCTSCAARRPSRACCPSRAASRAAGPRCANRTP